MCFATSEIGTAFGTVAAGGDDASRAACAEMAAFGRRLDDVVRRSMDERFAEQVVGSLDQVIGDMKAIKVRGGGLRALRPALAPMTPPCPHLPAAAAALAAPDRDGQTSRV